MTEVEMKVFDTMTLGRRMIRKRVWGKIPVIPLIIAVALSGIAAAVLLGPPSATSNAHVAEMTPVLNNVPTEILYGDILTSTQHPFTVGISQNSYSTQRTSVVPIVTISAVPAFPTDCATNLVVKESTDNGATYPTTLTGTFSAGVCTYTSLNAQTVLAGITTNLWYLEFAVVNQNLASGGSGTQISVVAQFNGS